ncbi:DUF3103 family protein [Streptomyces werraensis]|uniref:DUF3103 family protein n=1 Tax=Streptomyces werraensis TaxID=68284 RepID=UPI001CE37A35
MRTAVPVIAGSVLLGTAGIGSAVGAEPRAAAVSAAKSASTLSPITDGIAKDLATSLNADKADIRDVLGAGKALDLLPLMEKIGASAGVKNKVKKGNSEALRAKGLDATAGSVLELRLGHDSMRQALREGKDYLIVGEADDDARTVTAYDRTGKAHKLDAHKVPKTPVLVVGINGDKAIKAGLAELRESLKDTGVAANLPEDGLKNSSKASLSGYDATAIDRVYLREDHEPWHKGDAEIYLLVAGVNPSGEPQVDTVQMPYVNDDGREYVLPVEMPQIIVNWSHFKYGAADLVMMEEDGSTNYQELARAISKGLLTVVGGGQYVPLVDEVLKAFPSGWFSDDHDYVDSWYTVRPTTWDPYFGANNSAKLSFGPWHVDEI